MKILNGTYKTSLQSKKNHSCAKWRHLFKKLKNRLKRSIKIIINQ